MYKKCGFGSETTVCSRVDKEAEQNVRNWDKVVNIVSFSNRWSEKKNKAGTRTMLIILCWP